MNYILPLGIVLSLVASVMNGYCAETVAAMFDGAKKSVETVLSLAGTLCFWSGIFEIAAESGLAERAERSIRPLVGKLFPSLETGSKASRYITENITANLLGMGNAATPSGVAAMNELDKTNPHPEKPTDEMCMLAVLNTAPLQLVPSSVIAARAASGAANAADILPAVWICSAFSLAAAILSMKIILKFRGKERL